MDGGVILYDGDNSIIFRDKEQDPARGIAGAFEDKGSIWSGMVDLFGDLDH